MSSNQRSPTANHNNMTRHAKITFGVLTFFMMGFILQAGELSAVRVLDDVMAPASSRSMLSLPMTPKWYLGGTRHSFTLGSHYVPSMDFADDSSEEPYDPSHTGSMDEHDLSPDDDPSCAPYRDPSWRWIRFSSSSSEAIEVVATEPDMSDVVFPKGNNADQKKKPRKPTPIAIKSKDKPAQKSRLRGRRRLAEDEHTKPSQRLLIAVYADWDEEQLNITSPIQKAYGQAWKQDLVLLQGTAMPLRTSQVRRETVYCNPPTSHAALNQIRLLSHALQQSYDQVLLLDAQSTVVDLSVDVTTLLPSDRLVAASPAGGMLWNLRHADARNVAEEWFRTVQRRVANRSFEDGEDVVRLLREMLPDGVGTLPNRVVQRPDQLEATVEAVCKRFAPACEGWKPAA